MRLRYCEIPGTPCVRRLLLLVGDSIELSVEARVGFQRGGASVGSMAVSIGIFQMLQAKVSRSGVWDDAGVEHGEVGGALTALEAARNLLYSAARLYHDLRFVSCLRGRAFEVVDAIALLRC